MALSGLALNALLEAQQAAADEPLPIERANEGFDNALDLLVQLDQGNQQKRQNELKFGTPQVGEAASVTAGAPRDSRKRIFGIPLGARPKSQSITASNINDVPIDLFTEEAIEAAEGGQQLFFNPASKNFKPAKIGREGVKLRESLLTHVEPENVEQFLTEPDLGKALRGSKISQGTKDNMKITADFRQRLVKTLGLDPTGGKESIPTSTFNILVSAVERAGRPSTKVSMLKLSTFQIKDQIGQINQTVRVLNQNIRNLRDPFTGEIDENDPDFIEAVEEKRILEDQRRELNGVLKKLEQGEKRIEDAAKKWLKDRGASTDSENVEATVQRYRDGKINLGIDRNAR